MSNCIANGRTSDYITQHCPCTDKATDEKGGRKKHFSVTQHNSIISRVVQNKVISAIFNRNVDIAIGTKKLAQLASLFRENV